MNTRKIKTALKFAIAAMVLVGVAANAAVVTISTTAPTIDASDESNLGPETGLLKWFHDVEHDAGQTFTPSENLQLNAFTIRLGAPNEADANPERLNFRLGTITRPEGVFTFTDIYQEAAEWTVDTLAGDYMTFTLDEAQELTGGVEYGVILDAQAMGDWHVGIPYISRTGNTYAGGAMINRGGSNGADDLAFHADLTASAVDPELPTVVAGSNWIAWSDAPIALDDSAVINNSSSDLFIEWSVEDANGVSVVFSATDVAAPTITITKPAGDPITVTFVLSANYDGSTSDDVVDTMTVDVYDDACAASGSAGDVVFDPTDFNGDCITDIDDLAILMALWLDSYSLTEAFAK